MTTARAAAGPEDASLTAYVADFIVSTRASDIPPDVAHLGKRSILDGLGLALAGAASETGRIIRRYLDSLGIAADSGSTVIGGDSRLPARFAAFANGVSIHADDYDDTRRALSLAASQAGGLRENFGTMTKPFHAGRAAESGVVAAELAALGFTASPVGLEADRGFFRAAGGGYSADMIDGKLGKPWTFAFPGVSIKPHPSGSLTHPGMSVMLDLIERHDLRPERVKRVAVGTNHNMPNALIHHRPRNELQAKFSMEFCMAILLIERKAGLEQFTDAVVNRPDVQALLQRIDFGVHPDAEAAGFDKMTTIVEVEQDDGSTVKGSADFGKGSPANPMSDDELEKKFVECATWGGLERSRAQRIIDLAWRIDELENIDELMRLLAGARPA